MLELYHAGLTACSKKVRLSLREKGLSYVSHYVELGRFQQHDPDYLKLNPNGLVPTLIHDGVPVIESTVINEYLDDVFPEVLLRPGDPVERARMRVWRPECVHAAVSPYSRASSQSVPGADALMGKW